MKVFMFHLMPRVPLSRRRRPWSSTALRFSLGAPALLGRQGEAAGLLGLPV